MPHEKTIHMHFSDKRLTCAKHQHIVIGQGTIKDATMDGLMRIDDRQPVVKKVLVFGRRGTQSPSIRYVPTVKASPNAEFVQRNLFTVYSSTLLTIEHCMCTRKRATVANRHCRFTHCTSSCSSLHFCFTSAIWLSVWALCKN